MDTIEVIGYGCIVLEVSIATYVLVRGIVASTFLDD